MPQATGRVTIKIDGDVIRSRAGSKRDVTVSFETDTGAGWAIANAFVTEVGEVSAGEFSVTLAGPPANRTL